MVRLEVWERMEFMVVGVMVFLFFDGILVLGIVIEVVVVVVMVAVAVEVRFSRRSLVYLFTMCYIWSIDFIVRKLIMLVVVMLRRLV